jgi:hypothetical protein
MENISFKNEKEMVNWLIDNEHKELADAYGRSWKYLDYVFYFKDLGDEYEKEKIDCLHLCQTDMYIITS